MLIWRMNLWQDARYGFRILKRNPGFTTIAICSLALGIGANAAIFSTVKTILFDSLKVAQPEQLRVLRWEFPGGQPMYSLSGDLEQTRSGATTSTSFSYPLYQALKGDSNAFEQLTAFDAVPRKFVSTIRGETESVTVMMVSGNFFSTFRVGAAAGRAITASDDTTIGSGPVVEISDEYWERRFGRSATAIGTVIELNRKPMTIIGVVAASFTGPQLGRGPDMYVPLTMDPVLDPFIDPLVSAGLSQNDLSDGERWWLTLITRVRSQASDGRIVASLEPAFASTVKATLGEHHKDLDRLRLEISPGNRGAQPLSNEFSKTADMLIAVVGLVLLLACANLANLLLARSASRRREMGLRIALGARRSRIMGQVLTESIVLALLGGGVGLLLGYVGRNLVSQLLNLNVTVIFDWQVVTFTVLISLLTALLFGGFPAWQATLADTQSALQEGARITAGKSKALLGKSLVVAQVCLSAVLLIASGLFLTTLRNLLQSTLGFQPEHLLLFDLSLPETQYKSGPSRYAFFGRLQAEINSLPGVRTTTFSGSALLAGNTSTTNFDPDGENSSTHARAWLNVVGPEYFQTMGIPLVAGRGFTKVDSTSTAKVAIINLRLAREVFPNEDPIGRTFNDDHIRIVGICGNAKFKDLRMDPPPTYYLLYEQAPIANTVTFAVKTKILPTSATGSIRNLVYSLDHGLAVTDVRTQREQLGESLAEEKLFASLTSGFGLLALVLACVGIYGITAYTVSRRTNEIGIRMALGARSGQILGMILRESCLLALAGVAVATILTLLMGRVVQSFLYGLHPSDPLILIVAGTVLIAVALTASWVPAQKAARIDPMNALRHQ